MTTLAALAGAVAAAGLMLIIHEFTRRPRQPGTPNRRRPLAGVLTVASARRWLLAVAAGLVVLLVSRWPVAGISAALAVIYLPKLTTGKGEKKQIDVLEGLDQWIRRLGDLLTAGRGLEDALAVAAASPPAAIAGPVTTLGRHLAGGTDTEVALRAFAEEIADPAGDRIAAALIIAAGARGGGVRNVLHSLSDLLAQDVTARRQIEAERAQHRTTLRWITVILGAYTVFAVANRSYSAPFGTFAGQSVLAVAVCLYAGGLFWLHRLGNVPVPGRFLSPPAGTGTTHPGRRGRQ